MSGEPETINDMLTGFSGKAVLCHAGWFYVVLFGALISSLWAAYRWRANTLANCVRKLFAERLSEHDRLARERQDALLQGMQGLILVFEGVAVQIPPESPTASQLERALSRAQRLLIEKRDDAGDLCDAHLDLIEALRGLAREQGRTPEQHSFDVIGQERPLELLICDEVYKIAREAITSVFKNNSANTLRVTLAYRIRSLELSVREDSDGTEEQFGSSSNAALARMVDRAGKLGGRLDILNRPATQREIRLRIPASIAYRALPSFASRLLYPVKYLFGRRGPKG